MKHLTHEDQRAVSILNTVWKLVQLDGKMSDAAVAQADRILTHAIQHVARPDRDVYPKVRRSRKGNPVRRLAR